MLHKHVSIAVILAFAGVLLLLPNFNVHLEVRDALQSFYLWVDSLGNWQPLVFIAVNILIVVFALPGVVITVGAGFLFGFVQGVILVIIGTTIGAVIAFNISRYFFGEGASRYLKQHPKLKMLDDEFVHDGFIFILLTRFVPFFPFKLSNYLFGLAQFSQKHFVIGTALGIIPLTCLNVYIGSIASDLEALFMGEPEVFANSWWIYVLGLFAVILIFLYIRNHAKKALMRYSLHGAKAAGAGDSEMQS